MPTKEEKLIIAQVAHEAIKTWSHLHGNDNLTDWEDASNWQRRSAVRTVEFYLDGEKKSPRQHHDSWVKGKTDKGWKYGKVKDEDKKELPCLLAFDELPEYKQKRSELFAIITYLLSGQLDD